MVIYLNKGSIPNYSRNEFAVMAALHPVIVWIEKWDLAVLKLNFFTSPTSGSLVLKKFRTEWNKC
jgi:hypothetical protein